LKFGRFRGVVEHIGKWGAAPLWVGFLTFGRLVQEKIYMGQKASHIYAIDINSRETLFSFPSGDIVYRRALSRRDSAGSGLRFLLAPVQDSKSLSNRA
jgi:hypothetical protein